MSDLIAGWKKQKIRPRPDGDKPPEKKVLFFSEHTELDDELAHPLDKKPHGSARAEAEERARDKIAALLEFGEDDDLTMDEMIRITKAEEGDDDEHNLFGEGFGIQMTEKNRCGQYKTSKPSCENAGCKYSERTLKSGNIGTYCSEPPKKKTKATSPKKKTPASPKKKAPTSPQKKTTSPKKKAPMSSCSQYKDSKDGCAAKGCVPATYPYGLVCRSPPQKKTSSKKSVGFSILPVATATPLPAGFRHRNPSMAYNPPSIADVD